MADIRSWDETITNEATAIKVVAKPQGRAQSYRTSWMVSKNGGAAIQHSAGDKGAVGDGYYNFTITLNANEKPLVDGDKFSFYAIWYYIDSISGNTTKIGQSETVTTTVGAPVPVVPDWNISQQHLNDVAAANLSLTVDGVAAVVDTPVNANSVLRLTPNSGYLIKKAQVQYNYGGGVDSFVVAANKKSASLTWTSGAVDGVRFYLESEVEPILVYTLVAGDIKSYYKIQKNGVVADTGTEFYQGDKMTVICNDGFRFYRNYNGSPELPRMSGGDGAVFTLIEGTESAEWVAVKPSNNVSYTGVVVRTESIPEPYIWKQSNQDDLTAERVTLKNGSTPVVVGSALNSGDTLVMVADNGWLINSAQFIALGNPLTFVVAGDQKTATTTVDDMFLEYATYGVTINVNTEQATPDLKAPFNNVYKVDADIMKVVNKERWQYVETGAETVEYRDYGTSIISLLALPFDIDPSVIMAPESIQLAEKGLSVEAPKLSVDSLRVDLGSIVVDAVHNNSLDYVGVVALLHLPRIDPINIDLEYVIGYELRITYDIDLYSGKATVNIYSSAIDDVILTKQVDMSFNIPTQGRFNESPENTNVDLTGDNFVTKPFIEIVSTDLISADGLFSIPMIEEGQLIGHTGYVEVDNIKLDSTMKLRESELLINALKNGVIIQ